MADYYRGYIQIGGNLTRDQLGQLISAINETNSDLEFFVNCDVDSLRTREDVDLLAEAIKCGDVTHIEVQGDDLRWGSFESAEGYCVENGLPFIRTSESYFDNPACKRVFDGVNSSEDEGDSTISVSDILEMRMLGTLDDFLDKWQAKNSFTPSPIKIID